jgi:hypothetical protein
VSKIGTHPYRLTSSRVLGNTAKMVTEHEELRLAGSAGTAAVFLPAVNTLGSFVAAASPHTTDEQMDSALKDKSDARTTIQANEKAMGSDAEKDKVRLYSLVNIARTVNADSAERWRRGGPERPGDGVICYGRSVH